jgi:hypothetical protein
MVLIQSMNPVQATGRLQCEYIPIGTKRRAERPAEDKTIASTCLLIAEPGPFSYSKQQLLKFAWWCIIR